MRRRQIFLLLALSLITYYTSETKADPGAAGAGAVGKNTAAGGREKRHSPADAVRLAPAIPVPTPLALTEGDAIKNSLYMDVFNILKDDNKCSRFFGGPATSVHVLNQLTRQFRKEPLKSRLVGFQMSGKHINISNHQTGVSYRMFDKAIANSRGPIYNRNPLAADAKQGVGRFVLHSREARALMLLHELGHLIAGKDGKWLLPNDGGDSMMSTRNSHTVEYHCSDQLRALDD